METIGKAQHGLETPYLVIMHGTRCSLRGRPFRPPASPQPLSGRRGLRAFRDLSGSFGLEGFWGEWGRFGLRTSALG